MNARLFHLAETGKRTWAGRANIARYDSLEQSDIRRTPRAIFDALTDEFGPFDLDVAALPDNALCPRFYTPDDDGLSQSWAPARCWMNPPYSDIAPWTAKAVRESRGGALVVALLPVRTDLRWFHQDVLAAGAEVRFVRGRVAFGGMSGKAPFPSMVVVWRAA